MSYFFKSSNWYLKAWKCCSKASNTECVLPTSDFFISWKYDQWLRYIQGVSESFGIATHSNDNITGKLWVILHWNWGGTAVRCSFFSDNMLIWIDRCFLGGKIYISKNGLYTYLLGWIVKIFLHKFDKWVTKTLKLDHGISQRIQPLPLSLSQEFPPLPPRHGCSAAKKSVTLGLFSVWHLWGLAQKSLT